MEIQVQGHAVQVDHGGKGPPALFLHGVPDTAEIWSAVIAGVGDRYECFAPDFQGIHRSAENPAFDYSADGYADWVESLVTALGIEQPITLVVHDWGGLIGLAWACKYPQRIARVVAMNTAFSAEYRWHRMARIWRTPLLGELSMILMNKAVLAHELRRGSRRLSAAQIDAVWRGAPSRKSARGVILKLYRSADPRQLGAWAARFAALAQQLPVTVLWGVHDPYIPRRFAQSFHTGDVEFVEDSGHWLPAERPDRVIAALLRTGAS
jgi:pimeloyl-ACP methyl ester carboxylesterase